MAKIVEKHIIIKVSKLVKGDGEINLPEGTLEALESVVTELLAEEPGAIVEVTDPDASLED